jgi:hypothetical protein
MYLFRGGGRFFLEKVFENEIYKIIYCKKIKYKNTFVRINKNSTINIKIYNEYKTT